MGMTMTQKILTAHADLQVKAGQLIEAGWIWCLEMTSSVAINDVTNRKRYEPSDGF